MVRISQHPKTPKSFRSSRRKCAAMLSVCQETIPLIDQYTWLASFTGDNFRWEILGMLVALFGLAAIPLPDWDPLLKSQDESRNDRRKFACGMRDLV